MAASQCTKIDMDGGILDIGTRFAVYGASALVMGLGFLSIFNVKRSLLPSDFEQAHQPSPKELDDQMYKNIREHKRSIRSVSTTLNLTGIALVGTAFILGSKTVRAHQEEINHYNEPNSNSPNSTGQITLFHAYTLLSLLWLITLTGLMLHVHTWVFNVIRRQSQNQNQSLVHRDRRRFLNSIWNGTHWYLIQVELLGIYGYYVCTHRDDFLPPPCDLSIFNNEVFRLFAKIVYVITMIPILNVALFCVILVGTVWIFSLLATYLRGHDKEDKKVSVFIFHVFWFLICGSIAVALGVTTEVLLFANTKGQNIWTFGSLIACILLVVPAEAFVYELYALITHAHESFRHAVKTKLGTHGRPSEPIIGTHSPSSKPETPLNTTSNIHFPVALPYDPSR